MLGVSISQTTSVSLQVQEMLKPGKQNICSEVWPVIDISGHTARERRIHNTVIIFDKTVFGLLLE